MKRSNVIQLTKVEGAWGLLKPSTDQLPLFAVTLKSVNSKCGEVKVNIMIGKIKTNQNNYEFTRTTGVIKIDKWKNFRFNPSKKYTKYMDRLDDENTFIAADLNTAIIERVFEIVEDALELEEISKVS